MSVNISLLDWLIIALFFIITLAIGLFVSKKAGSSTKEFFLSGQNMPWWLLGVSMVATTFSADTPNLVTDIVRTNGVAGNWVWWAFLLTGMLTVFVYAKLWRRSGIMTDLEFYELRYSGKGARFLRAFRAIYLGVFFNVMIMATVLLAGIKIASVLLGLGAVQTVCLVSLATVFYSSLGGLRGVILTDFFQFVLSMIGMILAAIYIVQMPEIGGLSNLITHDNVKDSLRFIPEFSDPAVYVPIFIIPLAVQWWSLWYPGAEPGGGGYVAQRMLSSRDEAGAIKATLFFNIAHYALRPWPWIIIALASMIVFPDLESIQNAFPHIDKDLVKNDLAFPAMLSYLPIGLVGLVIAALIAALMSTISTHLNWGSSYVVKDFVVRFISPEMSEKKQVRIGKISTILLMVLAALFALVLSNALQAFNILLQIGAGTGLIFILRWFWWRINALSEIVAMVVSFVIAVYFEIYYSGNLLAHERMLIGIGITSIAWLLAACFGPKTEMATLKSFYKLIRPYSKGWQLVIKEMDASELKTELGLKKNSLATEILMMFVACIMVYSILFGIGALIYSEMITCLIAFLIAIATVLILKKLFTKNFLS